MFETLTPAQPDKILALIDLFRDDPRSEKVDLGVGVYKDAAGRTPVFGAIREAERRLLVRQESKSYLGPVGDVGFARAIVKLLFGSSADASRICACQTPGGMGALRTLMQLLHRANPEASIWTPQPSWPGHAGLIAATGLATRSYPYFDAETHDVRFDAMIASLKTAAPGDIVLLHGCCHNPTGADLDLAQWSELANVLTDRALLPFIDIAYQGFGEGLEPDAAGLRCVFAKVPEMVVAASCSKNFGVYRDRVGTAVIVGRTSGQSEIAAVQLLGAARSLYSMPPDHGAAAVRIVLDDAVLRRDWEIELEGMRRRMVSLRLGFAEALQRQSNSTRFAFVARQRGMFSRIGATADQVYRLRKEHAIYLVEDGRINVAGLPEQRLDEVARAFVTVLGKPPA